MFEPPSTASPLPPFRRFVAALGIGLVLLLGLAAASPVVHDCLHGNGAVAPAADSCAVVLFASGVTLAAGVVAVLAPRVVWREPVALRTAEIFLTAPRYLRQLERGPPVA